MGSPNFAVPALRALIAAGHEIACVYAQPPRPAGRGHKKCPCPVHVYSTSQGIEVRTSISLKDAEVQAALAALNADVAVVVAYGLILPKPVLETPRLGCINIHASLLPRWRGAAPIQRAIEAGDRRTGISIMAMDEGLDTGGVYLTGEVSITPVSTASELHDTLAEMGAELIVSALDGLVTGTMRAEPQPSHGISYAEKLSREEGRIDWSRPADELARKLRALNPWPGVWCEQAGERLKVLAGVNVPNDGGAVPGTVIGVPLVIACGDGALRIDQAQRPGKSAMDSADLVRGHLLRIGTVLD